MNSPDFIKFKYIDPATAAVVDKTTADRVLLSDDGVDFSYSEMTAVAGDFWSVKDANANIICDLLGRETKKTKKRLTAGQPARFLKAFNDMWHNPEYGRNGKFVVTGANGKPVTPQAKQAGWMPHLEEQLRKMLEKEGDEVMIASSSGPERPRYS